MNFNSNRSTRGELIILSVIIIIAFLVRLAYLKSFEQPPLSGDAANYVTMAKRFLVEGYLSYWGGGPDAFVTPGFPLFISGMLYVFGDSGSPLGWIRGAQIILSVLTVLLLFLIGKRVGGRAVGLLAAAAYALYPTSIWATALILTETLYIFLFVLYVYVFLQAMDRHSDKWTFASGVVLGLTVLVRPSVLPLAVMPLLYFILVRRIEDPIRLTLISLLGLVLTLIPWWIRNIITLDQFVMLATQAGNPLLAGTDPYFSIGDKLFENIAGVDQKALAIERIKEGFTNEPYVWLAWFTVGKLRYMFTDLWVVPHGSYFDAFQHIHQWSVYLGFASILLYRKIAGIRPLVWFVLIPTGLQMMFLPLTRYGFPMMPLLMILGATVVVYLIGHLKEEETDGFGYSSNYSGL